MAQVIQFRDASAPTDPDASLQSRYENTISTPINSISWLDNGQAIAGDYTVAATSGTTVDITCADPKNEHVQSGKTVVADDGTVNKDVVPGVGIVFSSSLANGWTAKVSVGALMASPAGTTVPRFNVGTLEVGNYSTQRRIAAFNVSANALSNSEVYGLPGLFVGGTDADEYVAWVKNHTDPSHHAIAAPGDYVLTFSDWQDLAIDTVDVYVNKDGGGANKAIEDAALDETMYQYGVPGYIDGGDYLAGMQIALYANGDPTSKTFTIYVREGDDWIEFAPDVTGSPGTWQAGPLTMTETGETTGTITASGYALFWVRLNLPISVSPDVMRLMNARSRGLKI